LAGERDTVGPLVFALDDVDGEAVAVSVAGRAGAVLAVETYRLPGDRRPAYEWIRAHSLVRSGSTLVVGASLKREAEAYELPVQLESAGVPETKSALSLFRQVANRSGVWHASSPDLGEQVEAVRVTHTSGGLHVCSPGDWSLVKVTAWAVAAIERERRGSPSVW
jgi:hypothetical protein